MATRQLELKHLWAGAESMCRRTLIPAISNHIWKRLQRTIYAPVQNSKIGTLLVLPWGTRTKTGKP